MDSNASSGLQDIVRRVVENLGNLQPTNSLNTPRALPEIEGSTQMQSSACNELHRCFQIPRLPLASSSAQNSSVPPAQQQRQQQSSYRDLAAAAKTTVWRGSQEGEDRWHVRLLGGIRRMRGVFAENTSLLSFTKMCA